MPAYTHFIFGWYLQTPVIFQLRVLTQIVIMEKELKAKELVEIFGKELAVKCIDEIIKSNPMIAFGESDAGIEYIKNNSFWWDVREIIIPYEEES